MVKKTAPNVMARVAEIFEDSGMSLDELGRKMGYPANSARKSAWQFIHRTRDPRLSMLYRFAQAIKVDIKNLL
ncbi:MAG: helix-turn-helix transcriptional regulator [Planctomycetes bacterium]|nr:helix-turn-helix transcriptional regulator [Planctomycetota bacterium]